MKYKITCETTITVDSKNHKRCGEEKEECDHLCLYDPDDRRAHCTLFDRKLRATTKDESLIRCKPCREARLA